MPITLNTILTEAGVSLADARLLRHQDHRALKGYSPYEMFRDDRPLFEGYQSHQAIKNRNRFGDAGFWVSFVATPDNDTLFAGLYAVQFQGLLEKDAPAIYRDGIEKAGQSHVYEQRLDDRLSDLIGKLYVDWGLGTRSWIQRADNQNKVIVELRREFKEPDFPGFAGFMEPLSRIQALPKTWIEPLRATRGVYLLTCPRTKEQYVGSAYGADGFWGRWQSYALSLHGGNVELKSREPSDYQVSILEVTGFSTTIDEILGMEIRWKAKLQSREMGLNRN